MGNWIWENPREKGGQHPRDRIGELLKEGRRVTAGYTTTQVKGYHDHWILWTISKNSKTR
jgi:hypothetical protein